MNLKRMESFGITTSAGIAVLAKQGKCIIYNLQNSVKEFAVVAESFYIKPLIQAFQNIERYNLVVLKSR